MLTSIVALVLLSYHCDCSLRRSNTQERAGVSPLAAHAFALPKGSSVEIIIEKNTVGSHPTIFPSPKNIYLKIFFSGKTKSLREKRK